MVPGQRKKGKRTHSTPDPYRIGDRYERRARPADRIARAVDAERRADGD